MHESKIESASNLSRPDGLILCIHIPELPPIKPLGCGISGGVVNRCQAFILNETRRQCRGPAVDGNIFCWQHDSYLVGECLSCLNEDDPKAREENFKFIMAQAIASE